MQELLTGNQLNEHIIELKDAIDGFDEHNQCKLVFFNAFSFYDHVVRMPSVNRLLDTLEPYIPLSLGVESLDLFVNMAREPVYEEEQTDYFTLKARVDFVSSVQKANTPERWAYLVDICGTIRDIKEQLLWLY